MFALNTAATATPARDLFLPEGGTHMGALSFPTHFSLPVVSTPKSTVPPPQPSQNTGDPFGPIIGRINKITGPFGIPPFPGGISTPGNELTPRILPWSYPKTDEGFSPPSFPGSAGPSVAPSNTPPSSSGGGGNATPTPTQPQDPISQLLSLAGALGAGSGAQPSVIGVPTPQSSADASGAPATSSGGGALKVVAVIAFLAGIGFVVWKYRDKIFKKKEAAK